MKVNDILKKVNHSILKQTVILHDIKTGKEREAWGHDFHNGWSNERDKTVVCINLTDKGMTINYK